MACQYNYVNDRCGGFVPSQTEWMIGKNHYQTTLVFIYNDRPLSGNG
jgi:hypothetical protein